MGHSRGVRYQRVLSWVVGFERGYERSSDICVNERQLFSSHVLDVMLELFCMPVIDDNFWLMFIGIFFAFFTESAAVEVRY